MTKIFRYPIRFCGFLVSVFCFAVIGLPAYQLSAQTQRSVLLAPGITKLHTLSQNWTDQEARWFYDAAQGSKLVPFNWFLHLEQPGANKPFNDPDYIRKLGYIPRAADGQGNPDGLPIGFVKDGAHLGLTCAACHTSLMSLQGNAWLIDGAPTLGDIESLQRNLAEALDQTCNLADKFQRFADAVLGPSASPAEKDALKQEIQKVLAVRKGYNSRNLSASETNRFGFGRVDAFGAILNEVTESFAQAPNNHAPANAPVSYPFLWDTPQHDSVQWNGAAQNTDVAILNPIIGTSHIGALGRNFGEVLGVFGTMDATQEGSLGQFFGYPSSINRDNLIAIEETLRKLWSPQWPDQLSQIDESLRAQGEILFEQNCRSCHARLNRTLEGRTVKAEMCAVGTDETMAFNFATRTAKSGIFEGRRYSITGFRRLGATEPVKDLLVHAVQRTVLFPTAAAVTPTPLSEEQLVAVQWDPDYHINAEITVGDQKITGSFKSLELVGHKVQEATAAQPLRLLDNTKAYRMDTSAIDNVARFVAADGSAIRFEDIKGIRPTFGPRGTQLAFSEPATVEFAYKARPLNGIWATAPYLHNGSVPNLDELLKPPADRKKKFKVGSHEFDPVHVGFLIDQGDFDFDTSLPGNSNAGHSYNREFNAAERKELIEYLKSL